MTDVSPCIAFTITQDKTADLAPTQINRGVPSAAHQPDVEVTVQVDADLAGCKALQAIPRLAYGMLRCALLMQRPGQHPDERVALRHLWASLPHAELRCALYPTLSSYSDPDTLVSVREGYT